MAIESETKGIRIAIDRGGTFCDLYVVHDFSHSGPILEVTNVYRRIAGQASLVGKMT
jgi:N-methylhydantoinase A/oxoprolinase/acetone carboxylase beta subunit